MTEKMKILVTGATGQQGGEVVRALLSSGHHVHALTRNTESPAAKQLAEAGAHPVKGDFSDTASLAAALDGVDGAFGVTTPYEAGTEEETRQGINLVDAAQQAGIGHLVFTSVARADTQTGIPHFDSKYEVEKHLVASGVPYTIVAPVFFMENWLNPWFLPSIQEGNVALAMPKDRPLAQIAVSDIGDCVRDIFEHRDEFLGKRFDLSGEDVSGGEVADRLGKLTGRELGYFEIPIEGIRQQNEDFAKMFEWFDKVGYNVDTDALKRTFPKVKWTSFDTWLKTADWSALDDQHSKAS